jgi:hypothetical protein
MKELNLISMLLLNEHVHLLSKGIFVNRRGKYVIAVNDVQSNNHFDSIRVKTKIHRKNGIHQLTYFFLF